MPCSGMDMKLRNMIIEKDGQYEASGLLLSQKVDYPVMVLHFFYSIIYNFGTSTLRPVNNCVLNWYKD
jgi:hypothetical protein